MPVEVTNANEAMKVQSNTTTVSAPPAGGDPVNDAIAFAEAAADIGLTVDEARIYAENDPELAKRLRKPRGEPAGANEDKGGEEPTDDGVPDSEDSAAKPDDDDDVPPEDGDGQSESDEQTEAEQPADGNSGEDGGVEFADDIIPGLKGKDFAKLPTEAREAIADHFTSVSEKVAEAEARLAELNKLLDDPLVAQRKAVVEHGARVQVRRMTDAERLSTAKLIADKVGLTDGEALSAMDAILPRLNQIINDAGQDFALQHAEVLDRQRKEQETLKQGEQLLLGLSKYNPDLAVKETELSRFYKTLDNGQLVLNESHPEIETFKNGIGKFVDWAKAMGMDYDKILKMGEKPFYAMVAAANGFPVAINTGERDKKMVANASKNSLAIFMKPKSGNSLDLDGGSAVVPPKSDKVLIDGINIVRLVEDNDYYYSVLDKDYHNSEWREKLNGLVKKGREIINKRKNRR